MARSDLLLSLVRAGSHGDAALFRRTVEAIISDERAKQHNVIADRLASLLTENGTLPRPHAGNGDASLLGLFVEVTPRLTLGDLILAESTVRWIKELVEEHERCELLRSHGLEPRHRVLLTGPPGNGKTSLAEALASALARPLFRVRYEGVIGSYLGETASRLRKVFDYVRMRQCVLFFDEFDTLGKERGDPRDTGEIKRVVSSLLMQIDDLPSYVMVITATNHPELLDRAVWRRFQVKVELPAPTAAQRAEWFTRMRDRIGAPLGQTPAQLAATFGSASFSELRDFAEAVIRRWVLSQPSGAIGEIVRDSIGQWKAQPRPDSY